MVVSFGAGKSCRRAAPSKQDPYCRGAPMAQRPVQHVEVECIRMSLAAAEVKERTAAGKPRRTTNKKILCAVFYNFEELKSLKG